MDSDLILSNINLSSKVTRKQPNHNTWSLEHQSYAQNEYQVREKKNKIRSRGKKISNDTGKKWKGSKKTTIETHFFNNKEKTLIPHKTRYPSKICSMKVECKRHRLIPLTNNLNFKYKNTKQRIGDQWQPIRSKQASLIA